MFTINRKIRREFLKRKVGAEAVVKLDGVLGTRPLPAVVADIPRRWNKEIDVVVAGTVFCGQAVCITAGDPTKITLLL